MCLRSHLTLQGAPKKHALAKLRYFDMFPPNFIVKYWKLQKLWSFYEKYQNFKLTKLTKRKKIFFPKILFLFKLTKLTNWNKLEKYQAYIQKPTNKTELEIELEKLSGTTFHKSPLRRLFSCSERDCKRGSELMVDTLSTYFHSNQHSRPSHKNWPFSGPPHNLKNSLEGDLCLFKLG